MKNINSDFNQSLRSKLDQAVPSENTLNAIFLHAEQHHSKQKKSKIIPFIKYGLTVAAAVLIIVWVKGQNDSINPEMTTALVDDSMLLEDLMITEETYTASPNEISQMIDISSSIDLLLED